MEEVTEEEIQTLTDLFQAFKLLQSLQIDSKGVSNVEDAKCRLLKYLQEKHGGGSYNQTTASELMNSVLEKDRELRGNLATLYQDAVTFMGQLPQERIKELHKNVKDLSVQMDKNLKNLQQNECAILIAGEVSAGKSSLLNLLLGENILPTSLLSCTSVMCELKHSNKKYAVVHPWDTSRHSAEHVDLNGLKAEDIADKLGKFIHQKGDRKQKFQYKRVEIFWPFPLLKGGIFIVDSPGIGESREMTSRVKEYLPKACAFIYVLNSANAGGLKPDRLQDLLAQLSEQDTEGSTFDPRSAIFVCNKWDLVPTKECQVVLDDTMEKLKRCWHGIDKSQVFCVSTTQATKSLYESGYVTQDFAKLLGGIENLLPISLQNKLERHYRWLSHVIRRTAFYLQVHIANENRSEEERKELTEHLHNQLDKLDIDSKRVADELKKELFDRACIACDQLTRHLERPETRTRLMTWDEADCPVGEDWDLLNDIITAKVNKRIRHEVNEWDTKNGIFTDIQLEMIQRFQEEFELMEDQLSVLEGSMTGMKPCVSDTLASLRAIRMGSKKPLLSNNQKILIGAAMPILIPLGVVAGAFLLPVAGVRAIKNKLHDRKMLKQYRESKTTVMAYVTEQRLDSFINKENLAKLVRNQLQTVMKNVQVLIQAIPDIIELDRELIDKLQNERERSQVSLVEESIPLLEQCSVIQGNLDSFYMAKLRQFDIEPQFLEWDKKSPPIASSAFGQVFVATLRVNNRSTRVAIKIRLESISVKNASDILMEEEYAKKLKHENLIQYYGTSAIPSDPANGLKVIMVMELCEKTLRSRIVGKDAKNPGKFGDNYIELQEAMRVVARYSYQINKGLSYIHERLLIHRNLQPQNIMLGDQDVIKLSDVGLAKPEDPSSTKPDNTICYAAPEVIERDEYSKASDIYSFSMIMWELWYGKFIQDELSSSSSSDNFEQAIRAGTRPSLTKKKEPPKDWQQFMKRCWSLNPTLRPPAEDCITFFENQY